MDWIGLEWSGVEWSGVEWSGLEWSGVAWIGARQAMRSMTSNNNTMFSVTKWLCDASEPLENQEHQLVRNIQQDTTAQASHHHCNDDGFDAARGIGMEMRLPNKPYIVESAIDTNHLDKSMNRHRTDA
jgi:hypothetical protein